MRLNLYKNCKFLIIALLTVLFVFSTNYYQALNTALIPFNVANSNKQLSNGQILVNETFNAIVQESLLVDFDTDKIQLTANNSSLEFTPLAGNLQNRKVQNDNQVVYSDVYPGIDFQYSIFFDHLKEDIVLKDPSAQSKIFFEIKGAVAFEKQGSSGYVLIDNQQKRYSILPLIAKDSANKIIDYSMTIEESDTESLILTIFPKDQVQISNAQFPIIIDPSVTWSFPLSAPTITSVSLNPIDVAGGEELSVYGENFFGYKQSIAVEYTGNALTNYIGRLLLDTQSLIAANKMRSDCGDIRVYQGNVKLEIELRYGCNTSTTEIDVKVPELSGNTNLELYYGDLSLTYESVVPANSNLPANTLYDFMSGNDAFGNDVNICGASNCSVVLSNGAGSSSTIPVEVYHYYDDVTYTSNPTLGNATADSRMLILVYHGNLTINSGVTVWPQTRKKGMAIYVAGTLINNGSISMSDRGAVAAGQNVFLYKGVDNSMQYVPANGGAGGAARGTGTGTATITLAGLAGVAGSSRSTGGGGSGGVNNCRDTSRGTAYSGAGSAGTSFSGGTGGGGIDNHSTGTLYATAGGVNGGAGGAAYARRYDAGWTARYAGGGAGNNGGAGKYTASGQTTAGNNASYNGDYGTGGLLIIFANTFTNAGTVYSQGSIGGAGRAAGGSSGGGSINIFYKSALTSGSISASGGAARSADATGGKGGDGTITTTLFTNLPKFVLNSNVSAPQVKIDEQIVQNFRIISSTEIKITTPAHGVGQVNIKVTNFDNQYDVLENATRYYIPGFVVEALPETLVPYLSDDWDTDITEAPQMGIKPVGIAKETNRIAEFEVNFTENLNWTGVTADVEEKKAFFHAPVDISTLTNGASTSYSLYIPKAVGNKVFICPGVQSLEAIVATCENGYYLDANSPNVAIINDAGVNYWKVSGLTGTGGMSLLEGVVDTLSRLQTNTSANHLISFRTTYGLTAPGHKIVLTLDTDTNEFDLTTLTLSDIRLTDGTARTLAALPGDNIWGCVIDNLNDTITFTAPTNGGYFSPTSEISILIGTNVAGGTHQIVNPTTSKTYTLRLTLENTAPHGGEESDFSIPIVDSDQVNISGFVNTYVFFDIDTAYADSDCAYNSCYLHNGTTEAAANYTVDLGELSSTWVNKSHALAVNHSDSLPGEINSIWFDLTTNAYNGAVVYVSSQNGGLQGPFTNIITSVTDGGNILANSSLYGFQLSEAGTGNGTISRNINCDTVNEYCGPDLSATEVFNTGGRPLDDGRIRLDIAAAAAYINNPGSYTDTLTFIAVPTF